MCEVRLKISDEKFRIKIGFFIEQLKQRRSVVNCSFLQALDKSNFPRVQKEAFDLWMNTLSGNIRALNACSSVDALMDKLWELKDVHNAKGIGEITIHKTAEILAYYWDLPKDDNCWSMAGVDLLSFCYRNNVTKEALVEKVVALSDDIAETSLMDEVIFVDSLVRSDSIDIEK